MSESVWCAAARALCAGLGRETGVHFPLSAVRVPARGADMGAYLPRDTARRLAPDALRTRLDAFPPVCGAVPFSECRMQGDFLLLTISLPLLDAAKDATLATLPPAREDCQSLALNRMRLLARKGPAPCPDAAGVRRALWLALGLGATEETGELRFASTAHRLREAEAALLCMFEGTPPRERPGLAAHCGGVADAAGRLLYRAYTERM